MGNGAEEAQMTGRFPTPWRIVEIPGGFAVENATRQQLGVFYGGADPNLAEHTGIMTMDEARQMALDFAKLPELLLANNLMVFSALLIKRAAPRRKLIH